MSVTQLPYFPMFSSLATSTLYTVHWQPRSWWATMSPLVFACLILTIFIDISSSQHTSHSSAGHRITLNFDSHSVNGQRLAYITCVDQYNRPNRHCRVFFKIVSTDVTTSCHVIPAPDHVSFKVSGPVHIVPLDAGRFVIAWFTVSLHQPSVRVHCKYIFSFQ